MLNPVTIDSTPKISFLGKGVGTQPWIDARCSSDRLFVGIPSYLLRVCLYVLECLILVPGLPSVLPISPRRFGTLFLLFVVN